jgi:predicted transcriptional regulator
MKLSRLEMYVEIIGLLAQKGPLKLIHIVNKVNLNYRVLKEDLTFLIKQGLVEERTLGKDRTYFSVTQRGINVLKYFQGLEQRLPNIEEAQNYVVSF